MAGAGEPASQRDLAKRLAGTAQQLARLLDTPRQQVLVRRQPEAFAKHACEVVFRQRTQAGQLAKAQRVGEMHFDEIHQMPAQMRRQAAFQAQPVARPA